MLFVRNCGLMLVTAIALLLGMRSAPVAAYQDAPTAQSTYVLYVCNESRYAAKIALSWYSPNDAMWKVGGWWSVSSGQCTSLGSYLHGVNLYTYADNTSYNKQWSGSFPICVKYGNTGFTRNNYAGYRCAGGSEQLRYFTEHIIDYGAGTFTWRLGN